MINDAALRVEPADTDQQPHHAAQQQGAGGHLDGDHRAPQERVEVGEDGRKIQVHFAGASNHLLTMAW